MPKLKQLKAPHREAIRLRYEGKTTDEIVEHLTAKRLKANSNTIKDWFRAGGLLEVAYENYCREQENIETEVKNALHKHADFVLGRCVKIAAEMVVALMGSQKDEVKLKAAIEVLDRVLGKPSNLPANEESEPNNYEEFVAQIEKRKKEREAKWGKDSI